MHFIYPWKKLIILFAALITEDLILDYEISRTALSWIRDHLAAKIIKSVVQEDCRQVMCRSRSIEEVCCSKILILNRHAWTLFFLCYQLGEQRFRCIGWDKSSIAIPLLKEQYCEVSFVNKMFFLIALFRTICRVIFYNYVSKFAKRRNV